MQAKYLQRGDKLVTVNGEQKIVEFIEHVIYEQPIEVYNFEVEGNHNYFVGKESRVLAHNACGQTAQDLLKKQQGRVRREFPSEFLNSSVDEINHLAQNGDKAAKKAMKLLRDGRFRK